MLTQTTLLTGHAGVKIGIGFGQLSVLHLGERKRTEYIAVGEPLLQAFAAEKHAAAGEVCMSAQAHRLVASHFLAETTFADGHCRIVKAPR